MKKVLLVLSTLAILPPLAFGLSKKDQKMDTDASGTISLEEYVASAKTKAEKKGNEINEAKLSKKFNKLDGNGDGSLDQAELGAAAPDKKKNKNKKKKKAEDAAAE